VARPRVLVVDDHDGTLQAIAALLRRDFAVWIARDASHAIAVARELDWDADLVVVDLMLGDGLRGDEFAAVYRTHQQREVPILLMSGALGDVALHPDARLTATLHKPFDLQRLHALVSSLVRGRAVPLG